MLVYKFHEIIVLFRWTIAMFNVIFTAWQPVVIGLFDRPVSARAMLENPALYPLFQKKAFSDKVCGTKVTRWNFNRLLFLEVFLVDSYCTVAFTFALLLIIRNNREWNNVAKRKRRWLVDTWKCSIHC